MTSELLQPRAASTKRVRQIVLWTSAVWSLLMLAAGFMAAFGMGGHETPRSQLAFALCFIAPAVFSLTAWRLPRAAGIALLLSAPIALGCIAESWADVAQVLSRVYLWPHVVFGLVFVLLGQNRTVEGEE